MKNRESIELKKLQVTSRSLVCFLLFQRENRLKFFERENENLKPETHSVPMLIIRMKNWNNCKVFSFPNWIFCFFFISFFAWVLLFHFATCSMSRKIFFTAAFFSPSFSNLLFTTLQAFAFIFPQWILFFGLMLKCFFILLVKMLVRRRQSVDVCVHKKCVWRFCHVANKRTRLLTTFMFMAQQRDYSKSGVKIFSI